MKTRKLSFNHWRYRLLHWVFSEKATTPDDSQLPKYLYTHYCPLFHLTNLLLIISPLLIIINMMCKLGSIVISIIDSPIRKILNYIDNQYWTEDRLYNKEWSDCYYSIKNDFKWSKNNLEYYYVIYSLLSKEDIGNIIDDVYNKYYKPKPTIEEIQKEYSEQFLTLINLSQSIFGIIITVLYFTLLAAGTVIGLLLLALITFGLYKASVAIYLHLGSVFMGLLLAGIILFLIFFSRNIFKSKPISIITDAFKSCLSNIRKFISDLRLYGINFYEQNCPPIEIEE